MFSIITIASSTTKPVEIVSAMRERLSRLYPSSYVTPKVPTIERGTATLGMMVADGLRRKRNSTITTSVAVPLSIVGTFGVMYLLGYSLDNLSLMALTISTGFVVDDAI